MNEKDYRPCVGIILLNNKGHVFAGQRLDHTQGWQMPQGGIDEGESPLDAAFRELQEETGVTNAKVLAISNQWHHYDLPADLYGKLWGGRYKGQRQKWFVMRFLGNEAQEINIQTAPQEFAQWQWMTFEALIEAIVPFKKEIYQALFTEFRSYLS